MPQKIKCLPGFFIRINLSNWSINGESKTTWRTMMASIAAAKAMMVSCCFFLLLLQIPCCWTLMFDFVHVKCQFLPKSNFFSKIELRNVYTPSFSVCLPKLYIYSFHSQYYKCNVHHSLFCVFFFIVWGCGMWNQQLSLFDRMIK